MGALNEGHFNVELENRVNHLGGCIELGFEQEPETLAIEDAVKVLLQGLGEDVNREGLRKTPLRVAKALREGTRGERYCPRCFIPRSWTGKWNWSCWRGGWACCS
ncbi:hypothetical protein CsSME_00041495 [Camellia sinensis var. sinensis]